LHGDHGPCNPPLEFAPKGRLIRRRRDLTGKYFRGVAERRSNLVESRKRYGTTIHSKVPTFGKEYTSAPCVLAARLKSPLPLPMLGALNIQRGEELIPIRSESKTLSSADLGPMLIVSPGDSLLRNAHDIVGWTAGAVDVFAGLH